LSEVSLAEIPARLGSAQWIINTIKRHDGSVHAIDREVELSAHPARGTDFAEHVRFPVRVAELVEDRQASS
jgi:hypothetical protein